MNGSKGAQQAGNVTTTQGPPQYLLPYISTAIGQAGGLLGSKGPQFYPGQTVAGFSDPQQAAMSGIDSLAANGTPGTNAAGDFDTTLLTSGMKNPYLAQQFNLAAGGVKNALTSQFGQSGRNVEASQPLEGEALDNLASTMYGNQYENTMQNALQAGNQAENLFGTKEAGLGAEMGVGSDVQSLAQQLINSNMQKYGYYQNLPYQQLGQYEGFLSGVTPGMQSTSPYFTNPAANALGMGMGAMGLYNAGSNAGLWGGKGSGSAATGVGSAGTSGADIMSSAMSDRRMKEAISKIGSTDDGINLYRFRYRGMPGFHIGAMADEVRKTKPDAVFRFPDGYDRVNYGAIT